MDKFPCFTFGLISHIVGKRITWAIFVAATRCNFCHTKVATPNRTCKPGVICRRNIGNRNVKPNKRFNE